MAKKILKWVGVGLGVLILVGGSVVLYLGLAPLATRDVPVMDIVVEATPARIARGKKLASILCSNCHYNSDDKALSGNLAPYPANFGTFYSENLTSHPTAGIGKWTDGQLLYFLRTGIGPDGRQRFMGSELHMSDEDVLSLIAFLRSDDPLVRPTDRAYPPAAPSFIGRLIIRLILQVPDFPTEPILAPDPSDTVAYGRYVAHAVAPCFGCHSGEVMGLDFTTPENSDDYMAGGRIEETPWGFDVYIPNITFDVETGIGSYTPEDFRRALKEGFAPDGRPLKPPMMLMPELEDWEVDAVYAYLKTLTPVHQPPKVVDEPIADPAAGAGEVAYYKYKCYSCHAHDGNGNCDLRKAHSLYSEDARIEAWIRDPAAFEENARMPMWDGIIAEEDYGPLIAYVRELGKRWDTANASAGGGSATGM